PPRSPPFPYTTLFRSWREAASCRTVDDHQPHEQRADPVPSREAHTHRGDDRDRGWHHRTEAREQGSDDEEDPRNESDPPSNGLDENVDNPIDRSVVLGQSEQISHPDQNEEEIRGKSG